ncbi:MAG: M20/M25/M40 family metallo-hydrolase [Actinoplanes sp.]
MDFGVVHESVARQWRSDVLPSLSELIAIPALSAAYDPEWAQSGRLRAAVEHMRDWIAERPDLLDASCTVVELDGGAPLLMVDVPATAGASPGTALLYGHLDKQPPQTGDWSDGLGPWQPVLRDERLYGRGSVDDGYSGYAAIAALSAVRAAGGEHAHAVLLLETGEESGSPDLPAYMDQLVDRLGDVTLVVCLDAGGGDFERLWLTASLRGAVQITVTVSVLESSVHSGIAGGIVPSSFRIMRQLLDRVEDSATGEILLSELNVEIPEDRMADARALAALQPGFARKQFPLVDGVVAVSDDDVELILNNTWRPALSVTGASGLPEAAVAGAVIRASTSLRLSIRTPPTVDVAAAHAALVQALTTDVPYGARVDVTDVMMINGWAAPALAPWLADALAEVGDRIFGRSPQSIGIGGGIPFMEMLGRRYPAAQFIVTGALGADSNMHGPDEWLHVPFAIQVTEAIAALLDRHAAAV